MKIIKDNDYNLTQANTHENNIYLAEHLGIMVFITDQD